MRVLYLALDLRPEVDEAESIHSREVVKALEARGHVVGFGVSTDSSPTGEPGLYPVGGGSPVREFVRVWSLTREFRPDVIYERRFFPRTSALLSALLGVPAFVEINGIVSEEADMLGSSRRRILPPMVETALHAAALRGMSSIVAVTRALALEIARRYEIPPHKLTVIENGANTQVFRPFDKRECRKRVGLDPNAEWLCFEGGLAPWHGVETLLRSVRILLDHGTNVKLAIVGDGPSRRGLESLARELSVQDRVRFFGRVPYETVPVFIGACDIGVGSFTRERNERIGVSPMKIYEYVACGRPVVVSRLPGVGEWVSKEGLGMVVEPDDPAALAGGIEVILADTHLREEMIVKGPSIVQEEHSWDAVASKLTLLFESAVDVRGVT